MAGGKVYWSDESNDLVSCPVAGCDGGTPTVLVPNEGAPIYGVAANPGRVYFAEFQATGNIVDCSSGGCGGTAAPLTPVAQVFPYAMAVQGSELFWTTVGDTSQDAGEVLMCPTTGCTTPTTLATGQAFPQGVASDGTTVYWINVTTGDLWSCPVASCSAATATRLATQMGGAAAIALYDGSVYWVDGWQPFYCPPAGCGDGGTPLPGGGSMWTQAIAVDATGIYWAHGFDGNIMKLVH